MKTLIVHAHHEPKSFSSALARQAAATLREAGHEVVVSDLYADGFDPVSDRRNFTAAADPAYLKQQAEEREASGRAEGFAPALEAEIRKLEWCDLLIFSFPLWWFGMPAILKGWVDRAFPMGRIYGGGKLYENGLGRGEKRGMVLMTTGGSAVSYSGHGVHPALANVLAPIEHGVFWFNGFLPLDPFVAWSPARLSPEERQAYLTQLDGRLRQIERETPRRLAPLVDFPGFGEDVKKRFMVAITRRGTASEEYLALIPAEERRVAELKRAGVVLSSYWGAGTAEAWRGFLVVRESGADQVREHLASLPLARYLDFEITELSAT